MQRIALLIAGNVAADAPNRRADAHLYELERVNLEAAFGPLAMQLVPVHWAAEGRDWREFSAALVMCAWDYQDSAPQFLTQLARLESLGVPVFNPHRTVEWNIRKTYLRDFEGWGVPCIPTLWPEAPTAADLHEAFAAFGTDDVVLKRQVGGGARAQERYSKATAPVSGPILDRPGMIQPFIPSIATEGEYSFLFIDGRFSHALVKLPKSGDYRIQEAYGGTSRPIDPPPADMAAARAVLSPLPEQPLYARVDMVRGQDGRLLLMELEVIEPYLFPKDGPGVGALYAAALKKRIG